MADPTPTPPGGPDLPGIPESCKEWAKKGYDQGYFVGLADCHDKSYKEGLKDGYKDGLRDGCKMCFLVGLILGIIIGFLLCNFI